jgi:hypothetical protein
MRKLILVLLAWIPLTMYMLHVMHVQNPSEPVLIFLMWGGFGFLAGATVTLINYIEDQY